MNTLDLTTLHPMRVAIGFLFSTGGGALVLWFLIERLAWPYVAKSLGGKGKPERTLTLYLGICERASYTAAIMLGASTWIGVWLAVKVAAQWKRWQGEERALYNVFLIGNILSIFFGLVGACIALGKIPLLGSK
jgi:hypothetical protein